MLALTAPAPLVVGCASDAAMNPIPPGETPITELTLGAPLALKPELLHDTQAQGDEVGFVAGLPAEAVALVVGKRLFSLPAGPAGSKELHDLGRDAGTVRAVLAFGGGQGVAAQVLVGGDQGLFAVVAGILEQSPLSPALGGAPVLHLLDSGTPDAPEVWIITSAGIHLWSGGVLRAAHVTTPTPGDGGSVAMVDPAEAGFAVCRAAGDRGSRLLIAPSATSDRLLELPAAAVQSSPAGQGADLEIAAPAPAPGFPISLVTCDRRGAAIVVTRDGILVEIAPGGAIARWRLPSTMRWLSADPGAPDVWMGNAHQVLHGRAGAWQVVDADWGPFGGADTLSGSTPTLARADLGGPLLVAGPQRVGRVRVQTAVEVRGLDGLGDPPVPPGIDRPMHLAVVAPYPDLVRSIDADLDGVAQWSDTAGSRVAINPWSVPPGAHSLRVTVRYSDAPPLSALVKVTITPPASPPTWTRDVGPIYTARCKKCHGPNGSGHLMDNAARWQSDSATIVAAVSERRMPLPPNEPLDGVDVALIAGWRATGFTP